jgi:hypothetical protein
VAGACCHFAFPVVLFVGKYRTIFLFFVMPVSFWLQIVPARLLTSSSAGEAQDNRGDELMLSDLGQPTQDNPLNSIG